MSFRSSSISPSTVRPQRSVYTIKQRPFTSTPITYSANAIDYLGHLTTTNLPCLVCDIAKPSHKISSILDSQRLGACLSYETKVAFLHEDLPKKRSIRALGAQPFHRSLCLHQQFRRLKESSQDAYVDVWRYLLSELGATCPVQIGPTSYVSVLSAATNIACRHAAWSVPNLSSRYE